MRARAASAPNPAAAPSFLPLLFLLPFSPRWSTRVRPCPTASLVADREDDHSRVVGTDLMQVRKVSTDLPVSMVLRFLAVASRLRIRGCGNKRYEDDQRISPSTGVEYGLVEESRVASPLLVPAPPIDPHSAVVDTPAIPAALPAVAASVIVPVAQRDQTRSFS